MRKRIKRRIIYSVLVIMALFIFVLIVFTSYTNYPQFEPVREIMDEIKPEIIQNFTQPHLSVPLYKETTVEDIIKNPDIYMDKNVSVVGTLSIPVLNFWRLKESKKLPDWYLCDDQGYTILLLSPLPYENSRSYEPFDKYEVKGKIVLVILENVASTKWYIDEKGDVIYLDNKTELAIVPVEMIKIT